MFVLASLLAASLLAQDPVRVGATLSASRVDVGSPTTLRITVETRGDAPDAIHLPTLPRDLDIVSTSDFSQTMISVPGGRSRATRREVVIVARRPGVFRIPSATIEVGGRSYRTRALELVVSGGPGAGLRSGPAADDDPVEPGVRSTIRMWLHPDTVFVGQQVLLHAEATFGEDARGRQTRPATFDPPAPAGFWVQEVPNPVSVALRVREGRTIETQTFRRAYFPLDAGSYTIPPAQLYYEARRGFLMSPETRRIASDSARLVVLPLPARGQPTGFSGAVGRLTIRATVSPDRIAAGDAAMLTVEVEGTGNVKALPEPVLPPLENVEVFPPTQESTVEVENLTVGGAKRFHWVLVPQRPGMVLIPPVEYSVFDPELRQYVTLRTDTMRIEADAVAGMQVPDTVLRAMRPTAGREPAPWARTGTFAALQAVPLLLLALVGLARRRRDAPPGPRDHYRRVCAELAELAQRSGPDRLAALDRLLHDAAVSVAGVATEDPVAGLRAQGRAGAAYALAGILREISRLRFAPGASAADERDLFTRAEAFLQMIEPAGRRRAGRGVAASAVVLALVAAAPVQATQQREPAAAGDAFAEGMALHAAGRFAEATRAFHTYATAHPRDPNGWYNLGLAAHAAGDPGRAAWAWLRASRLVPRDADLRHNLRAIGAVGAAQQVRAIDMLAPGERAAVASAAWCVLILALGLARAGRSRDTAIEGRTRRRASGWLAWAAATVLVVAGAAALYEAVRPTHITTLGTASGLYAGPSSRDEAIGELRVGDLARVIEGRGDWLRVRLAHGREAWVERAGVASP